MDEKDTFYDRFGHVVLLGAPFEVLPCRLRTRRTNPCGASGSDQAEVRTYLVDVEPLLLRGATLGLDGRWPVDKLAYVVKALLVGPAFGV